MANIKSQKKRVLTNEKNRQRNMAVRTRMRTMIKQALEVADGKNAEQITAVIPKAISSIDRAVTKGVIHRNSAARKKAMIHNRLNASK